MWLKLKPLRGYFTGYSAETRRWSSVLTYFARAPRLLLRSRRIALGVVVVGVLGVQPCRAASPVVLELEAEPGCTTEDQVQSEVVRLVGETEGVEPTRAHVWVASGVDVLHLRLEIWVNGERYVREVDVPSCQEAAKAAALILALAIRPDFAVSGAPPPSVAPPPPPPPNGDGQVGGAAAATGAGNATGGEGPAAEVPTVDEALPEADMSQVVEVEEPRQGDQPERAEPKPKSESSPISGTLALGYEASAFALPEVTQGVLLGLGMRKGSLGAEAYGLFQLPVRVALEGDSSRGGEFSEWQLGLRACYSSPLLAGSGAFQLEGGACAQGEVGQIRAVGFGTGATDSTQGLWGALGGGGQLGLGFGGPATIRLNISALAPLVRDSFEWQGSGGQSETIASVNEVLARFEVAVAIAL